MKLLKPFIALGLFTIFASGCASTGPRLPEFGVATDPAPLIARLDQYNASLPDEVRVAGRIYLPDSGGADFGARVLRGEGSRLDVFAGPTAKPLFGVVCLEEVGCNLLFPDKQKVIRQVDEDLPLWVASLVTGRVPLIAGAKVFDSYTTKEGQSLLKLVDEEGGWQAVLFGSEIIPERVYYGREGEDPIMEIAYGGAIKPDVAYPFPNRVLVIDEDGDYKLDLAVKQAIFEPSKKRPKFNLRVPAGTALQVGNGEELWDAMGFGGF